MYSVLRIALRISTRHLIERKETADNLQVLLSAIIDFTACTRVFKFVLNNYLGPNQCRQGFPSSRAIERAVPRDPDACGLVSLGGTLEHFVPNAGRATVMSAKTSSLDLKVLSKVPKNRTRCEAQLVRTQLPALLCEFQAKQAAEGRSLLGEANGERCTEGTHWVRGTLSESSGMKLDEADGLDTATGTCKLHCRSSKR